MTEKAHTRVFRLVVISTGIFMFGSLLFLWAEMLAETQVPRADAAQAPHSPEEVHLSDRADYADAHLKTVDERLKGIDQRFTSEDQKWQVDHDELTSLASSLNTIKWMLGIGIPILATIFADVMVRWARKPGVEKAPANFPVLD